MSEEKKPPADEKVSEEMLRERAYYIWEKEGRPEGRDLDHWLVATGEFPTTGETASKSTAKKTGRKKAAAKSKKKAPKKG